MTVTAGGTDAYEESAPATEEEASPSRWDGPHLVTGVTAGVGSPEGYVGGIVGYEPASWFGMEGGVGMGGSFGPGISEMLRFQLPIAPWQRMGVGIGVSQNFLVRSTVGTSDRTSEAPGSAWFMNVEFTQDFRAESGLTFRFGYGFGFLVNGQGYGAMCHAPTPAVCNEVTEIFAADPTSAAANASSDRTTWLMYFHLDLLHAFQL